MEVVEQPPKAEELRLLLDWDTRSDQARSRRAGTLSIAAHVAVLIVLASLPREVFRPAPERRHVTPLVAPPPELTQKAPNNGKVSKSFDLESLQPRPRVHVPASPPPSAPVRLPPQPKPIAPPAALPEPPKVEVASKDAGPKLPVSLPPAGPPPPQIQAEEHPKLAFENVGAVPSGKPQGPGKLALPSNSVDEAVRNLARSGGGGMSVGDVAPSGGGIAEALNQSPKLGKQGSNLQLLSDPMGVDFKPYLFQILANVRRNWFAVMPESVNQGRRGRVLVQFAIAKNGEVTKVVFAAESGVDALDRAAVAAISMSNPFPPLPTEFRGNVVRLQFTFMYNMPVR